MASRPSQEGTEKHPDLAGAAQGENKEGAPLVPDRFSLPSGRKAARRECRTGPDRFGPVSLLRAMLVAGIKRAKERPVPAFLPV
jgi:hypothetical protein